MTRFVVTLGIARVRDDGKTEEVCHSRVNVPMSGDNALGHFDNYLFILCSNRLNQEQTEQVKQLIEAAS